LALTFSLTFFSFSLIFLVSFRSFFFFLAASLFFLVAGSPFQIGIFLPPANFKATTSLTILFNTCGHFEDSPLT
jgi:hypothetical protein